MTFDQKIETWTLGCSAVAAIAAVGVPFLIRFMDKLNSESPTICATWYGTMEKDLVGLEIHITSTAQYRVELVTIAQPAGALLAPCLPGELSGRRNIPGGRFKPEIASPDRTRLPGDPPLVLTFAVKPADPAKTPLVARLRWSSGDRRKGTADVLAVLR